jgi:hypothetical protein
MGAAAAMAMPAVAGTVVAAMLVVTATGWVVMDMDWVTTVRARIGRTTKAGRVAITAIIEPHWSSCNGSRPLPGRPLMR